MSTLRLQLSDAELAQYLDLGPYVNPSYYVVQVNQIIRVSLSGSKACLTDGINLAPNSLYPFFCPLLI